MKNPSTSYSIFLLYLSFTTLLPSAHATFQSSPSSATTTSSYTYSLAPRKNIVITDEQESYHAYLLEELDENNTLQYDLGSPQFSSPQGHPSLLQHIQQLPPQHQQYYLHLLPTTQHHIPYTLWIGKNLLGGGGSDTPAMKAERERINKQLCQTNKEISTIKQEITKNDTTITELNKLLHQSPNLLQKPQAYQKALQRTKEIEKQRVQYQTEIQNQQHALQQCKLQRKQYKDKIKSLKKSLFPTQSKPSTHRVSICEPCSKALLYLFDTIYYYLPIPKKASYDKKQKTSLALKVAKAQLKQCREDINTIQNKIITLEHRSLTAQNKQQQLYNLLQQIHQFQTHNPSVPHASCKKSKRKKKKRNKEHARRSEPAHVNPSYNAPRASLTQSMTT